MHKNKSKIILKTKNICFSVTFCRSSFFLFFLIIVLSVLLRFTASDSSFCKQIGKTHTLIVAGKQYDLYRITLPLSDRYLPKFSSNCII